LGRQKDAQADRDVERLSAVVCIESRRRGVDPSNKLLWHFPRQRLEGEVIRDAALAVSGMLTETVGGASMFPELRRVP